MKIKEQLPLHRQELRTRTTVLILAMTASVFATPAALGYPMTGADITPQSTGINYVYTNPRLDSTMITQIVFGTGYTGLDQGHFESVKMLYDTAQSVIRKFGGG